ncbi:MAG: thiamine-phosphate kinase [Patescibacteria group bacterium]
MNNIDNYPLRIKKLLNSSPSFFYCRNNITDDDTGIIDIPNGILIVTSDFINYRPAFFDLKCGDIYDYGYLVATANLSDLYGTGAKPYAFSVGIRLTKEHTYNDFQNFMKGVKKCCEENKVPIIAGDTKIGNEICAFGTAIGHVKSHDSLFTRDNAKPGDIVCLSGNVGGFNCAVEALNRKKRNYSSAKRKVLINAITRPKLDRSLSLELSDKKIASGGIDLSDGLGGDLCKLAQASGVGIIIDAERIPIPGWVKAIAKQNKIPAWYYAFSTGGDFKFVFTAKEKDLRKITTPFYQIGVVTENKKLTLRLKDGGKIRLPGFGHSDTGFEGFMDEVSRSLVILEKSMRKK